MPQIRVVVVDDSALMRDMIREILSADDDILIVGEAGNGRDGVELVRSLRPDIVTMDIEMPIMSGIVALEKIMASHAVPVLMISARGDARTAYAAVSKGALEVMSKSEVDLEDPRGLIDRIKLLSKVKVITHIRANQARKEPGEQPKPLPIKLADFSGHRIVAIASSTGGPKALSELLIRLPQSFPYPVAITQHISDGFVAGMVEWLSKIIKVKIKVGEDGEPISPGMVYMSPSEKHMKVTPDRRIELVNRKPKDLYRPSCDLLLASAADAYGAGAIGVILTGMGSDGAEGMARIKARGGLTIAQDEKSCAVFGMPRAAIEKGCIDRVLSLDRIGTEILSLVSSEQ